MTTLTDLNDAVQQLADTAPAPQVLDLSFTTRRSHPRVGYRTQLVLVCAAAIALLVTPTVLIKRMHGTSDPQPIGRPNSAVTFATSYWFGKNSLPGFHVAGASLDPLEQGVQYVQNDPPSGMSGIYVGVRGMLASPATDANLTRHSSPVRIHGLPGYYQTATFGSPTTATLSPQVAWQFRPGKWAVVTALQSARQTPERSGPGGDVPKKQLLAYAAALTPQSDDHAAMVKIGYLPASMRFDGAEIITSSPIMAAPDYTTGNGYRSMTFETANVIAAERALPDRAGSALFIPRADLQIVSTYNPSVPLSKAVLPDENSPYTLPLPSVVAGPWTKTSVQGHLAWAAPHEILIQWGNVQISVSSTTNVHPPVPTGIAVAPGLPLAPKLLPKSELLKIANSLTVPSDESFGSGYPLTTAVPDHQLQQ